MARSGEEPAAAAPEPFRALLPSHALRMVFDTAAIRLPPIFSSCVGEWQGAAAVQDASRTTCDGGHVRQVLRQTSGTLVAGGLGELIEWKPVCASAVAPHPTA